MSRERRREPKRPRRRPGDRSASLGWLLTTFIVAILLNTGLMTSSSYMLLMRLGALQPLRNTALWPMLMVVLCILVAD